MRLGLVKEQCRYLTPAEVGGMKRGGVKNEWGGGDRVKWDEKPWMREGRGGEDRVKWGEKPWRGWVDQTNFIPRSRAFP